MHNSPLNIKFILDISLDAYGCSYDNTFILFKSSQNLIHLIYSNLKKSIISYNLSNPNKFQILTEIKNAHNDYIDNFRYVYDSKNKIDLVLSLSSGDNNIKIWNLKNWECLHNIKNVYKYGSVLSACFLLDEHFNYNYIVTCNFFLYNITLIDLSNQDKNVKNKEIVTSINTNIFIDTYYDERQSKYYIIVGNNFHVSSYDFTKFLLYHKYEISNSTNHKTAKVYSETKTNIVKIIFPCREGYLVIFNFHSGELINKIFCGTDNLIGLCLWADNFIFTGGQNKKLKLVDLNLKSVIKELNEHNQWICSIKSIKHNTLGQILITHGLDNKIKLWAI